MEKVIIQNLSQWTGFAETILKRFPHGAVIGLSGELGAGKTTLVREIIQLIASKSQKRVGRVMSPTFVIHQSYEDLSPSVDHFDLYRMDKVSENMLIDLEYFEIVDKARKRGGFVFVEWPEQCVNLNSLSLDLRISIGLSGTERHVEIHEK